MFKVYLSILFSWLSMLVGILIGVAFMIILERRVLGYIQLRKGPNKVGLYGVIQSVGDAIKLFVREFVLLNSSNYLVYLLCPILSLFISLLLWSVLPVFRGVVFYEYGLIFFFCCTSVGVYTLIGSGWSSNSVYSLIGSLRGVAQSISYEVRIILVILSLVVLTLRYDLITFRDTQELVVYFSLALIISFILIISLVAETNRSPFDFAEGESELVSGFNVEYGRGGFAILFLSEYSRIIFMGIFRIRLLLGFRVLLNLILVGSFLSFTVIWLRGSFPSYRYDMLINLAWKIYLPLSLNFLFYYIWVALILSH